MCTFILTTLPPLYIMLYSRYYTFQRSKSPGFLSWDVLGELIRSARAWVWVPVPFTLLAWLGIHCETRVVSITHVTKRSFGVSVNVRLIRAHPFDILYYTMTDVACSQTSQETPTIQWTKPFPTCRTNIDKAIIRYDATSPRLTSATVACD